MGSIMEGYVNRGDIGLLMGGKRGPEVEPLRPKGETNGSVLDSLKLKELEGAERESMERREESII